MYTEKATFSELLELESVQNFMEEAAPGMIGSPAMEYMKGMTVEQLLLNMPEKKRGMFCMLLDVANGKKVEFEATDPRTEFPEIETDGKFPYDIDDVDGSMYMLDHKFSGCLVVRFSKQMDESVYGKVVYEGEELPKGTLKEIATAGNIQMLGIPVRSVLKEYDKDYSFKVEGFRDTDGNEMQPQIITVHTLPKKVPDPAYEEHDSVALQAAEEGIVLLKNEDKILPLKKDDEIMLWGAEQFRIGAVGAGRINPKYSISVKWAVEEYSDFAMSESAKTVLFVISRPSGENYDNNAVKGEFYLSDEEEETLLKLKKEGRQVIAVINSGYPMDMRWTLDEAVKAVLWCGLPGMLGGKALVEILDGRVNPSGKLPDTWSLDYGDIPASANFYQPLSVEEAPGAGSKLYIDTCYEEDLYVGYRYFETFEKPVMYPFGFGLSYTEFNIQAKMMIESENAEFAVIISNIGNMAGKEVVQIYAELPEGDLEQPKKRLVGFAKTKLLNPGDTQEVDIHVTKDELKSYDEKTACWIMEAGNYQFYTGNSVKTLKACGDLHIEKRQIIKKTENLMRIPVEMDVLSRKGGNFPKGEKSGIRSGADTLEIKTGRKHYPSKSMEKDNPVSNMAVEELARLSVCASHGWGMHEKGEAGRIYRLEKYNIPSYTVADGNNGVNIHKPNIGMPCSNTVCATWNKELAYEVGRVIAEEAKENEIQMILAPAMNIHRNPLNGRHPECFSEDPLLAGIMAGNQSKGLEEHGVSSCVKHVVANNCEASRKRNHSIVTERALREIYLRAFEVALSVHQPDSIMTGYNAVNGCYAAEDEELIQGIFRGEFGFKGFVMTDWESYETVDIAAAVQAGNCWITPGSQDDTYVRPIVEGVKNGTVDEARLRENVNYMLNIVAKRTGRG